MRRLRTARSATICPVARRAFPANQTCACLAANLDPQNPRRTPSPFVPYVLNGLAYIVVSTDVTVASFIRPTDAAWMRKDSDEIVRDRHLLVCRPLIVSGIH